MLNHFQLDYYTRLDYWRKLRENISNAELKSVCIQVDEFWQKAPISNYYLHPNDIESWPDPWQLLNDNQFCYYARALGMMYTLYLAKIDNIEMVEATDIDQNQLVLVLVDNTYILNYWPNTVQTNQFKDFQFSKKINIEHLLSKIK